jgi:hypothetical protein
LLPTINQKQNSSRIRNMKKARYLKRKANN